MSGSVFYVKAGHIVQPKGETKLVQMQQAERDIINCNCLLLPGVLHSDPKLFQGVNGQVFREHDI